MTEEVNKVMSHLKELMDKAINHLESELRKIRAGKASPSMLDGIMVEAYGSMSPLSQMANIATPDARSITVQPWDKTILADVEKAIFASNLGITPQNDGEMVRLNIPPLTQERRKELVKQTKKEAEHAKVGLRNARKWANDEIKKLNKDGLSDDLAKDAEAKVQDTTNSYGKKVDELIGLKEKEIMSI